MHKVFARLMATFKRLRSSKKDSSDRDAELELVGRENNAITKAASEPENIPGVSDPSH